MMKNSCRLLLILIGLWMANVSLAQKTFRNPIITGMNPDPSICRVGDDFYLVTSTFEYFPGLPVYHSKDLVHWKLIGHALSRPENNPLMGCNASTGGQYAPTLRYHDGTFYVIGTNYGGKGSQGVFYVTAKNPAGPWSGAGEQLASRSSLFRSLLSQISPSTSLRAHPRRRRHRRWW